MEHIQANGEVSPRRRRRSRRRYPIPPKTPNKAILLPASIIALSLLAAICVIVFWLWPDPVGPPERDLFYKLPRPIAFETPAAGPSPAMEPVKEAEQPKGGILIEK